VLVAVVSALLAALLYAVASVMQQRAAAAAPAEKSLHFGLLTRLAHNPLWLAGIAADVAGYVAQFVALDRGTLVLVQPLLVCGLLFALPLGAALSGARLSARDWLAAASVCAGLAVFLVIAGSAHGHGHPTDGAWVALMISAGALCALLVAGARGRPPHQRAALLSGAAGVIYGVSAGFTKTAGMLLRHGVVHLLVSWQVWALVVSGVVGMVIAQSAFQAGDLDASLPTMTVSDPVVSILIGAAAFGESLPSALGATVGEVVSLAVMATGVFFLARSKAVHVVHEARPSDPPSGRQGAAPSG
jgi:drug/metabolite transporter (DMT)-like permease